METYGITMRWVVCHKGKKKKNYTNFIQIRKRKHYNIKTLGKTREKKRTFQAK